MAANVLNGIQNGVISNFTAWLNNALVYATALFGIVGVTGAIVTGVRYYATNSTWEGVTYPLSDVLLRLIVPVVLLRIAGTFLPNIFGFASTLTGGITGVTITGPGDIWNLGVLNAVTMYNICTVPLANYLSSNPLGALGAATSFGYTNALGFAIGLWALGVLAGLSIAITFTFIAAELLVSTVNILFVTSIGAIQLGWAAAPGTSHMAAAYWAGVQSAVFRVIVLYGVASFITTAASAVFGSPGDTQDVASMCVMALGALTFSWAAFYLALRIPSLAEHAFSGRPSLAGSDLAQHITAPLKSAATLAVRTFK